MSLPNISENTPEIGPSVNANPAGDISLDEKSLTRKSCDNCHQPVDGAFCSKCGQSVDSTLKYFWVVILHLLDDIFSFDSRASRTLWPLMFKPAFLTKEYFAGRRVHYVPPLRLYLFVSIVFFISLKFIVGATDTKNLVNVNNEATSSTQVVKAEQALVKQLQERLALLKVQKEQSRLTEDASIATSVDVDITKLTTYLQELSVDDDSLNNVALRKVTRKLVPLEFKKLDDAENFTPADVAKLEKLSAKREALLEKDAPMTITNNSDGGISFDFLSDEQNKKLDAFAKEIAKKAEKSFNADAGPLIDQVLGKLPQLMFILLPIFAGLLKLMFLFSGRLYMEHLTVALHSHSFIFVSVLIVELFDLLYEYVEPNYAWLAELLSYLGNGLLLWIPIYLFIMQKRVYQQGYLFTLFKYHIIGILYVMLLTTTALAALIWGLAEI